MSSPERLLPARSTPGTLEKYGEQAGCILGGAAYSVSRIYNEIQTRISDAFADVSYTTRDLARQTQHRVQRLKEERPLQVLAVIGAAAFSAGIALRIWRSRS